MAEESWQFKQNDTFYNNETCWLKYENYAFLTSKYYFKIPNSNNKISYKLTEEFKQWWNTSQFITYFSNFMARYWEVKTAVWFKLTFQFFFPFCCLLSLNEIRIHILPWRLFVHAPLERVEVTLLCSAKHFQGVESRNKFRF